jgi:hypothetical protein
LIRGKKYKLIITRGAQMKVLNISQRKQRLVDSVSSVSYNQDELNLLHQIIESHITYDLISPPKEESGYMSFLDALRWNSEDGNIWAYGDKPLTLMQYTLCDFPKVFIFLTQVPLERVPLYLWKPGIAPFAEWRTKIHK